MTCSGVLPYPSFKKGGGQVLEMFILKKKMDKMEENQCKLQLMLYHNHRSHKTKYQSTTTTTTKNPENNSNRNKNPNQI